MAYSMRTLDFRYTMWIHFNRVHLVPDWLHAGGPIYAEELYDHRGEALGSLTQYELVNVAGNTLFAPSLLEQRTMLLDYLQHKAVFEQGHVEEYLEAKDTFFNALRNTSNESVAAAAAAVTRM